MAAVGEPDTPSASIDGSVPIRSAPPQLFARALAVLPDALRTAWFRSHPSLAAGLIFHSGRGSQYASQEFRNVLAGYGIAASMSRRGNFGDNACSETLFGSLKVERLHGQRFVTRRQAQDEVIDWLFWYNRSRLHSTLGYVSPLRFEENGLADQARRASA